MKTTERHSLAVCGSHCGEKKICLYLSPFTGLIKNSSLNKSKFSSVLPLSKMVRKTNFLIFQVLVSEIVTFMSIKKGFL